MPINKEIKCPRELPIYCTSKKICAKSNLHCDNYFYNRTINKLNSLEKQLVDLSMILNDYLSSTAYGKQVAIDVLPTIEVNPPLFSTAIDNLIRNGLKYNDSDFKMVAVFMLNENTIGIQDNGRGMTQEEFEQLYALDQNKAQINGRATI